MANIADKKKQFPCTQCGGELTFAPGTSEIACPYCGHRNTIDTAAAPAIEEFDFLEQVARLGDTIERHEVLTVSCAACGATTRLGPNVTAGRCAFCGTPVVATSKVRKEIKPGALLPFAIDQGKAVAMFRGWVGSRWLAPNDLKRFADDMSGIAGMYVPYWTYDAKADSNYSGQRGDYYWATESYTAMVNGRPQVRTRPVRRIRWTPVSGRVHNVFNDLLILASRTLPRSYTEALEPWDLVDLKPYADEYLSGFSAESYQIELEEGFELAKDAMKPAIYATINADIGGDAQRIDSLQSSFTGIRFRHILLPIWISSYRYRGKVYRFMVNGRTGEVQGERPWSMAKIGALSLSIAVLLAVLIFWLWTQQ